MKGDVLFSCLGTTIKAAGSQEAQWKIDYEYQYRFAKIASDNGGGRYVLESAGFASLSLPMLNIVLLIIGYWKREVLLWAAIARAVQTPDIGAGTALFL
ncbi:hypothetical protein [Cohnella sp. GbtcB17]|uniref:hypothetical protein n=1 Tax=Cohnella sp. GbtcB17 TaxID=2824762 RepID=UPI001C2F2680|nr:hypothetical protein [Cohnella sp. GbtcB17]